MKRVSIFNEKGQEIYFGDIVLPGDTVYCFSETFGVTLDYNVETMIVNGSTKDGFTISYEAICSTEEEMLDDLDFEMSDLGETVFLSEDKCKEVFGG